MLRSMSGVNKRNWFDLFKEMTHWAGLWKVTLIPSQVQWISIAIGFDFLLSLPWKENQFARIWWELYVKVVASFKEEILERVLMPKDQRRFNDGGLGFDKDRMLWLRVQSSVSYLQDQVYSQSDDSISLSSYLGSTLIYYWEPIARSARCT